MCGGLKITKVSFGRPSSAGLLFLVPGGQDFFRSLQHPLVPRRRIVHLRSKGPYGSVNSECEPVVHRRAVRGSECLEVVLETIQSVLLRASLAWIFPPRLVSVHQPLREAPGGLSGHGSREHKGNFQLQIWRYSSSAPIIYFSKGTDFLVHIVFYCAHIIPAALDRISVTETESGK